jgi:membrane fusion protein (multidrug efflux system)
MYVRAHVVEGVDPVGILAPQQAVSRDEKGQPTAMVVDAQGKAQARILSLGAAVGNQWRVIQGLKPGDRLIVQGGANARPGTPVRVTGTMASPPATPPAP